MVVLAKKMMYQFIQIINELNSHNQLNNTLEDKISMLEDAPPQQITLTNCKATRASKDHHLRLSRRGQNPSLIHSPPTDD